MNMVIGAANSICLGAFCTADTGKISVQCTAKVLADGFLSVLGTENHV